MTWPKDRLTRDQARRKAKWLLDVAINRRAGIPDVVGRKQESGYRYALLRDRDLVHDRIHRRRFVRKFETPEFNRRFAYLLHEED